MGMLVARRVQVSRVASGRAASCTPPPSSDENTNPNPNQNTVTPDEEDGNLEDCESYTGLDSSDKRRALEAAKTSKKANSRGGKKKRTIGTFGTHLHHQVDSVSEEAIKQAYMAVAAANATLHVPGRTSGQPVRKLLLIEINECQETKAHGGRPTVANLQRPKTVVVIAGARDRREIKYVLDNLIDSLKHEKTKTHDRVELSDPNGDFVDITQDYIDARARARSQPSTKPRPTEEILHERHNQHNQRRNSL
jgi:hypothetical protein